MTEEQERLSQRGLSFVEDRDLMSGPPKLTDSFHSSGKMAGGHRSSAIEGRPVGSQLLLPKDEEDVNSEN
jgi:hypothetical protein